MSKSILRFYCLCVVAIAANEATAATLSNAFTVCAAVTENCTINTDPGRLAADYPAVDALPHAESDSRSVAVRCTGGADPEISVARLKTGADPHSRGLLHTIVATVAF